MIPLDKLKQGMIIKYNSSPSIYNPLDLIIESITPEGPRVTNLSTGYRYGAVSDYDYFHRYNSTKERILNDLRRSGIS